MVVNCITKKNGCKTRNSKTRKVSGGKHNNQIGGAVAMSQNNNTITLNNLIKNKKKTKLKDSIDKILSNITTPFQYKLIIKSASANNFYISNTLKCVNGNGIEAFKKNILNQEFMFYIKSNIKVKNHDVTLQIISEDTIYNLNINKSNIEIKTETRINQSQTTQRNETLNNTKSNKLIETNLCPDLEKENIHLKGLIENYKGKIENLNYKLRDIQTKIANIQFLRTGPRNSINYKNSETQKSSNSSSRYGFGNQNSNTTQA